MGMSCFWHISWLRLNRAGANSGGDVFWLLSLWMKNTVFQIPDPSIPDHGVTLIALAGQFYIIAQGVILGNSA